MGYYSKVAICCEKDICKELLKVMEKHSFLPDSIEKVKGEELYLLSYDWVKWYDWFPEVESIQNVLDKYVDEEKEGYGWQMAIIGEDNVPEQRSSSYFDDRIYVTCQFEYPPLDCKTDEDNILHKLLNAC